MIVSGQNFYCLFIGILSEPFDVTCLQEEEPVKEEPPVETEEDEEKKKKQVGDCGMNEDPSGGCHCWVVKGTDLQSLGLTAVTTWVWTPLGLHVRKYCRNPKYSDIRKICCIHPKIWTTRLYHRVMLLKDADGMANSVGPDQTAPLGAIWFGSALFAQAYLSENLRSSW